MRVRFRPPMFAVAAALLGLIALLATLQYHWLGQVSAAERERMQSNLATRASAFASDFDKEVTRAYLTFQVDGSSDPTNLATQVAERYERWQATSRYPRLVRDIYLVGRDPDDPAAVRRFNATTRFIEPAQWPGELTPIRDELQTRQADSPSGSVVFRSMPRALWDAIPAVVVPMPMLMVNSFDVRSRPGPAPDVHVRPSLTCTILLLDRQYIRDDLLPALAQQHFRGASENIAYDVAVVNSARQGTVYTIDSGFNPEPSAQADASADLFQIRLQDFPEMTAEVRRFTSFVSRVPMGNRAALEADRKRTEDVRQMVRGGAAAGTFTMREGSPVTIMLQHNLPGADRRALEAVASGTAQGRAASTPAPWRLVVKHPSGSLERAVGNLRWRNLLVSSGILAVLGVSVGFLLVTTRRAQDLARQQMEFVAAVSHELRTPLAVIRSAADNLAEGVVHGDAPVRKYGELVRDEGRRLSEMVEQILELAGIQSGQRGFALRPVGVLPLLHEVVRSSEPLLHEASIEVEFNLPDALPAVLADEPALRRVFQNLVSNAIKYGATGGWIGITATTSGREVQVTIADRGIGVAATEQENIFKPFYRTPDVIAAQIQGAGLGLSLVQRIVEAHGGRITLQSVVGKGSEFTVHLPSATEEPATRTNSAATPAPSSARS